MALGIAAALGCVSLIAFVFSCGIMSSPSQTCTDGRPLGILALFGALIFTFGGVVALAEAASRRRNQSVARPGAAPRRTEGASRRVTAGFTVAISGVPVTVEEVIGRTEAVLRIGGETIRCAYAKDVMIGSGAWTMMIDQDTGDVVLHQRPTAEPSVAPIAEHDQGASETDYFTRNTAGIGGEGLSPAWAATTGVIGVLLMMIIAIAASLTVGPLAAVLAVAGVGWIIVKIVR